MFEKINSETANNLASMIGLTVMGLAMSVLVTEHSRALVPATATTEQVGGTGNNELRRERSEEVHPHAASYSVSQRTAARAGRV